MDNYSLIISFSVWIFLWRVSSSEFFSRDWPTNTYTSVENVGERCAQFSLSDPSFCMSDRIQLVILSDSFLFSPSVHFNGRWIAFSRCSYATISTPWHSRCYVCMRISISALHCHREFSVESRSKGPTDIQDDKWKRIVQISNNRSLLFAKRFDLNEFYRVVSSQSEAVGFSSLCDGKVTVRRETTGQTLELLVARWWS